MVKKQVKCIVCGAVFDEEIDICPVCGVGREYFVPYEEEKKVFKKDTNESFVILGNGIAGVSAAEKIREINSTCNITIVSSEAVLAYNRPMLTKSLNKLDNVEDIFIHNKDWYDKNNIINKLNTNVKEINTKEKYVELEDGQQVKFDKCIYALGAKCNIPSIKGADKIGVIAIRELADVDIVKEQMKSTQNVVVIGGGVLGLEAAWQLSKKAKVTVLEVADKLMVRQLDDRAGELIAKLMELNNIDFKLSANIVEISGNDKAESVILDSGEEFKADLVIVSAGIRSNIEIAKECGINVKRAINVNEKMETNVKDIYACGDCAEYNGINYALWHEAMAMGKVAGANAAGDNLDYIIEPANLTFDGMGTSLFAAGDVGKNDNLKYKYVEVFDEDNMNYEKYYFVNEKLVGVILLGNTKKMKELLDALKEGKAYNKLFK